MSDESQGWGPPHAGTAPPVASAPAGWYPDPWSRGQHRYWDGEAWTAGSFPHGPGTLQGGAGMATTETIRPETEGGSFPAPGLGGGRFGDEGTDAVEGSPAPPVPPPQGRAPSPPPPPEWASPSPYLNWGPQPPEDEWDPMTGADAGSRLSRLSKLEFVALVLAVMLVVGSVGTLGGYFAFRHRSNPSNTASGVPPTIPGGLGTTPSTPADPDASALQSLVLNQADVPSTYEVQLIPGGDQVTGEATLDLCNGTFASESRRTARLQVAAVDGGGDFVLSTEAVLYDSSAATEEAFSELKSVVANCPSTPVVSPVGEPTIITQFNGAPDGSWAQTPTVTRQAYDFTSTDDTGTTEHSVAVYLRRGRALMGIYFSDPDSPQVPVKGQDTIQGIASVFAARMAALPSSVVGG
jgi:hypothetical protein